MSSTHMQIEGYIQSTPQPPQTNQPTSSKPPPHSLAGCHCPPNLTPPPRPHHTTPCPENSKWHITINPPTQAGKPVCIPSPPISSHPFLYPPNPFSKERGNLIPPTTPLQIFIPPIPTPTPTPTLTPISIPISPRRHPPRSRHRILPLPLTLTLTLAALTLPASILITTTIRHSIHHIPQRAAASALLVVGLVRRRTPLRGRVAGAGLMEWLGHGARGREVRGWPARRQLGCRGADRI